MVTRASYTEADRQSTPRTLAIERPDQISPELIETALRDGANDFACGFLPDEVEWSGLSEWYFVFCERFRFSPFVFEVPRGVDVAEGRLLLVGENLPAIDDGLNVLARSLSDAMQLSLRVFDIVGRTSGEIAREVAAADVVFSDVQNWSIGFAIDELAAVLGHRVVRLRHPGYSPVRFAVLGRELPAIWSTNTDPIRPKLMSLMRQSRPSAVPELRKWFGDTERENVWREWYSLAAFRRVWPAIDPRWVGRSADFQGVRWLERPAAWAAVVAAIRGGHMSAQQSQVLQSIVARWVGYDPPKTRGAMIRELGIARLTRLAPEWMQALSAAMKENRNVRRRRDSWVETAIAWEPCPAPTLPVIQNLEGQTNLERERRIVLGWRDDWGEAVETLSRGFRPALRWRMACSEAIWSRAVSKKPLDRDATMVNAYVCQPDFPAFFGATAPILGFVATLRTSGTAHACSFFRKTLRELGLHVSPLWIAVARGAFSGEADWLQWLRTQTRRDSGAVKMTVVGLIDQWLLRNRRELWKCKPSPATSVLLAFVCGATDPLMGGEGRKYSSEVLATKIRACSIAGNGKVVIKTMEAGPTEGMSRSSMLGTVAAINLWRRGCLEEARRVLVMCPLNQSDSSFHRFLRAVAAQLLCCDNEVEHALAALGEEAPDFFVNYGSTDPRWAWMGVLLKMAGEDQLAGSFRARAASVCDPAHAHLLDLIDREDAAELALHSKWKTMPGLFC